jgi:hypothetical protein
MPGTHAPYPPEFRRQRVELVRSYGRYRRVSRARMPHPARVSVRGD